MLIEVSLEGGLEGREKGFQTEGKWEGVPYMWAIGREREFWSEGCAGREGRRQSEDSGREIGWSE